jgi:hypothetical protein
MTTISDSNVHVYRVLGGNTDDQAAAFKDIFTDAAFSKEHRVVSFNSINWTRSKPVFAPSFHPAARFLQ